MTLTYDINLWPWPTYTDLRLEVQPDNLDLWPLTFNDHWPFVENRLTIGIFLIFDLGDLMIFTQNVFNPHHSPLEAVCRSEHPFPINNRSTTAGLIPVLLQPTMPRPVILIRVRSPNYFLLLLEALIRMLNVAHAVTPVMATQLIRKSSPCRKTAPLLHGCNRIRGGPFFRTGFSILSAKGLLGPHPPTPKSFQLPDKNLST